MFNNIISKIFFGRGAENKALDNGVKQNVINFVHRCSEYKRIKGKHPDIICWSTTQQEITPNNSS